MCGLFAAGMFAWYQDFVGFCDKRRIPLVDARPMITSNFLFRKPDWSPPDDTTYLEYDFDKEAFVQASSLLGDRHRFTLLRSWLAAQRVLEHWQQTSRISLPFRQKVRALWSSFFGTSKSGSVREDSWWPQSVQRYSLLGTHMDTAVKLAYVGTMVPWMRENAKRTGKPQLFVMEFYSLADSVATVRKK
jgi:hypothetical protein